MLIYKETFKDYRSFVKNNKATIDADNLTIDNGITMDSDDTVRSAKLTSLILQRSRYSKNSFILRVEFPEMTNGSYHSFISLRGGYTYLELGLYKTAGGGVKLYAYNTSTGVVYSSALTETYTTGEDAWFAFSFGYSTDKVYYYTNKESASYSTFIFGVSGFSGYDCRIGNAGNFDGQPFGAKIKSIAMYDIALSEEEIADEVEEDTSDEILAKKALVYLPLRRTDITTDNTAYTLRNYGNIGDLQWGDSSGSSTPLMTELGAIFDSSEIILKSGNIKSLGDTFSIVIKSNPQDKIGTQTMACIGGYSTDSHFLLARADDKLNVYFNQATQIISLSNFFDQAQNTLGITLDNGVAYIYSNGILAHTQDLTAQGDLDGGYFLLGGYHSSSGSNSLNYTGIIEAYALYDFALTKSQHELLHQKL